MPGRDAALEREIELAQAPGLAPALEQAADRRSIVVVVMGAP
jgi:hypothetical protein